ncbi:hypothetical protein BRADI_3g09402v3 [Brachypodium distachyon]|uniref:Uncharacterized protein n=1 Tax=Brachypodium distachyon TaxID=15368 RepID=A0A0Q3F3U1_BRADI|nr:hypothetical protein BRADI_3g09402v3 [Brachypodium distachyon]
MKSDRQRHINLTADTWKHIFTPVKGRRNHPCESDRFGGVFGCVLGFWHPRPCSAPGRRPRPAPAVRILNRRRPLALQIFLHDVGARGSSPWPAA